MIIGVIGVPGSGKSRFAGSLKRAMPEMSFSIVDGYAEKLANRLDMSLGIESTYVPNIHIASYREQEIRKSTLENKNTIVCGTMFDTLCYTGFHAEIIANAPGTQEEKSSVLMREMTAAQLFAYLAIDSFASFDHMFYLPITDPELLVAISSRDDKDAPPGEMEALDKTLQDALRRYGNPATVLNGKNNQNVKNAVEVIKSGKNGPNRSEAALVGE
jgi:hypothetical protein